jgi:hypothetical protein
MYGFYSYVHGDLTTVFNGSVIGEGKGLSIESPQNSL